jgi:hypothetical protein
MIDYDSKMFCESAEGFRRPTLDVLQLFLGLQRFLPALFWEGLSNNVHDAECIVLVVEAQFAISQTRLRGRPA